MRATILAPVLLTFLALPVAANASERHAMGAMGSMQHDGAHARHMRMTPRRKAKPGDRAKLRAVQRRMAKAIAKYRDIRVARRDGYIPFGEPEGDGNEVHYVHVGRSIAENWRLKPEAPGALLYNKRNGKYRLVGAMYVAPQNASLKTLNERLPLSQTRWHLHTNICTPRPIWSRKGWARKHASGKPLFGPESPISTRKACRKVGGKFHPAIFGWMAHVYL